MLGLVVCALVVSAALPLREYLTQRGEIAAAVAKQSQEQSRVDALEHELQQWQDPAYVTAQARARLHYVLPGEIAYVVLAPSASPSPGAGQGTGVAGAAAPAVPGAHVAGPEAPWYSQVWGSIRAADKR